MGDHQTEFERNFLLWAKDTPLPHLARMHLLTEEEALAILEKHGVQPIEG